MALFVFGCRWFFKTLTISLAVGLCFGTNSGLCSVQAASAPRQAKLNSELNDAVNANNALKVKRLLDKGADPNAVDRKETALSSAVGWDRAEIVRLLLDKGAKIDGDVTRYEAEPLLIAAADTGNFRTLKLLFSRGARVDLRGSSGQTALMVASETGDHDEIALPFAPVPFLVSHGADIQASDKNGQTALMYAAAYGSLDAVDFLIRKGARVDVTDKNGRSALCHAASSCVEEVGMSSPQCVRRLLKAGANPNHRDHDGNTPLMEMYDLETDQQEYGVRSAKILIAYGANPSLKNKAGRTALQLAQEANLTVLAKYFQSVSR